MEREQPAPGVTAPDIERWLDCDRDRLRRLEARRLLLPDEVLEAEIAMVRATIGQLRRNFTTLLSSHGSDESRHDSHSRHDRHASAVACASRFFG